MEDPEALPLPKEARLGLAHWPPAAWRPFDSNALASTARALCAVKLPRVTEYRGSPRGLSWWLAANLPADDVTRQQMLQAPTAVARLTLALECLRRGGVIKCLACGTRVNPLRVDGLSLLNTMLIHSLRC